MNLESSEEDEVDISTLNERDKRRPKKVDKTRKASLGNKNKTQFRWSKKNMKYKNKSSYKQKQIVKIMSYKVNK